MDGIANARGHRCAMDAANAFVSSIILDAKPQQTPLPLTNTVFASISTPYHADTTAVAVFTIQRPFVFVCLSHFRVAHADPPRSGAQSVIGSETVHDQNTNPKGAGNRNTRLLPVLILLVLLLAIFAFI